jgi:hypothetical protein
MEVEHRLDMRAIEARAAFSTSFGAVSRLVPFVERPAGRQIAVDRIMGRGLVGDDVGRMPRGPVRADFGGVAEQTPTEIGLSLLETANDLSASSMLLALRRDSGS